MLVIICTVVFTLTRWHIFVFSYLSEKTEIFKYWINKLGIWAPVVYLLGYVLRPLIFFPSTPFAILGGVLFGTIWGAFYIMIGTMCSSICEFVLVRYFVGEKARQFLKKKTRVVSQVIEKHGFLTVFFIRLIPNIAFDLQNCGLALAPIKFSHYLYGTFLGCLPVCIFYASFGYFVTNLSIYYGASLIILFMVILYFLQRFFIFKIKNST
jgi:uncharacterized membrane protein YdjX (TVP38/TMEM64 family)